MAEPIKGMFVKDGAVHFLQGSSIVSMTSNGKEPRDWPQVHFANFGVSEEFMEPFCDKLLALVDATLIFGTEREAVKDAITTALVEGLMRAFEQLRLIRLSVSVPMPEITRQSHYENFAKALWHAYKDLFPKAAALLGFDLGFQFDKEARFERGLAEFSDKYPPLIMDVPALLKRQRVNWQQGLSEFRNEFLEHRKKTIAEFAAYYQPQRAEMLFDHAWRTMADVLIVFIEARLGPNWSIMPIPPEEQNPNVTRRWRFFQCATVDRGRFGVPAGLPIPSPTQGRAGE